MILGAEGNSCIADVVVVTEGTANLGAYLGELRANYLVPTLEQLNSNSELQDADCESYNGSMYALVTYLAADSAPDCLVNCYPTPTCHAKKFFEWMDKVPFIGGAGEGQSHVAEGLATALQIFEDLQQTRLDRGSAIATQKHCILVCNSPPYPVPCSESMGYVGMTADQLAGIMSERGVNLSIISPRKIPALLNLYDKANGDLQAALSKNYAKDRRHLVLLKGFKLQERPLSPATIEAKEKQKQTQPTQSNLTAASFVSQDKLLNPPVASSSPMLGSPSPSPMVTAVMSPQTAPQLKGTKRPATGSPPNLPPPFKQPTPAGPVNAISGAPGGIPGMVGTSGAQGPMGASMAGPRGMVGQNNMTFGGGNMPPNTMGQTGPRSNILNTVSHMNKPNPPNVTITNRGPPPGVMEMANQRPRGNWPNQMGPSGPQMNPGQLGPGGPGANPGAMKNLINQLNKPSGMGGNQTGPGMPNEMGISGGPRFPDSMQGVQMGPGGQMGQQVMMQGLNQNIRGQNPMPNPGQMQGDNQNLSSMNQMGPGMNQMGNASAVNQAMNFMFFQGSMQTGPNQQNSNINQNFNAGGPNLTSQPMSIGQMNINQTVTTTSASMMSAVGGPGHGNKPGMGPGGPQGMGGPGVGMGPGGMNPTNAMSSLQHSLGCGPGVPQSMGGNMPMSGVSSMSSQSGPVMAGGPQMMGPGGMPIPIPQGVGPGMSQNMNTGQFGPMGNVNRQKIWQGILEWQEKNKLGDNFGPTGPQNPKISHSVTCQVFSTTTGGETEVNASKWPNKLIMQLIPRQLIMSFGSVYFKQARNVMFVFNTASSETEESLNTLTNSMATGGFAGCVHFPNAINNDVRVLMLLYNTDKKSFIGFIPNDQVGFVNAIRNVITNHKKQTGGVPIGGPLGGMNKTMQMTGLGNIPPTGGPSPLGSMGGGGGPDMPPSGPNMIGMNPSGPGMGAMFPGNGPPISNQQTGALSGGMNPGQQGGGNPTGLPTGSQPQMMVGGTTSGGGPPPPGNMGMPGMMGGPGGNVGPGGNIGPMGSQRMMGNAGPRGPPVNPIRGSMPPQYNQIDMERQQNLLDIQRLQESLLAAQQKEMQFKQIGNPAPGGPTGNFRSQQFQVSQQLQQQRMMGNPGAQPQLRHLLQQQAMQQQMRGGTGPPPQYLGPGNMQPGQPGMRQGGPQGVRGVGPQMGQTGNQGNNTMMPSDDSFMDLL